MTIHLPQRTDSPRSETGHIRVEELHVTFGDFVALERLSLDIPSGTFLCLLGPSGCGKSTVLNCVAGFELPTSGKVSIDGKTVVGPGPDRGVVFQQPTLFPWKTVRKNIGLGLTMRGLAPAEIDRRVDELLKIVGLSAFGDRYPQALSGGMQQRTAIARVLAIEPSVLLMDEPFAALDAQTRAMMHAHLHELWTRIRKTVLFITHDLDEALLLGDRIAVMSASPGRIIADFPIPLPRPRTIESTLSPTFIDLKRRCLDLISEQALKAFEVGASTSASR
ncbi:MAG TPA: ABC transporter ATP-binding protein [Hyphomicrobium sp.]|nr:ABC transporter ATP-binding protein [Hyphomicrobium sp.]